MTREVARCVAAEISSLRKELRAELCRELSHELRATDVAMRRELRDLCAYLERGQGLIEPLQEDLKGQAQETLAQPQHPQITRPKSEVPDRHSRPSFRKQFGRCSGSSCCSEVSTRAFGSSFGTSSQTSFASSLAVSSADSIAELALPAVHVADDSRAEEAKAVEECLRKLSDDSGSKRLPGAWDAVSPATQSVRRTVSARPAAHSGRPGGASSLSGRGPNVGEARRQIRSEQDGLEERKLFDRHLGSIRSHCADVSFANDSSFMELDHPMRSALS